MMMMIEEQTDRHFLLQKGKNGSPGSRGFFVGSVRSNSVFADSLSLSLSDREPKTISALFFPTYTTTYTTKLGYDLLYLYIMV
jgi:hypothetical protein